MGNGPEEAVVAEIEWRIEKGIGYCVYRSQAQMVVTDVAFGIHRDLSMDWGKLKLA